MVVLVDLSHVGTKGFDAFRSHCVLPEVSAGLDPPGRVSDRGSCALSHVAQSGRVSAMRGPSSAPGPEVRSGPGSSE